MSMTVSTTPATSAPTAVIIIVIVIMVPVAAVTVVVTIADQVLAIVPAAVPAITVAVVTGIQVRSWLVDHHFVPAVQVIVIMPGQGGGKHPVTFITVEKNKLPAGDIVPGINVREVVVLGIVVANRPPKRLAAYVQINIYADLGLSCWCIVHASGQQNGHHSKLLHKNTVYTALIANLMPDSANSGTGKRSGKLPRGFSRPADGKVLDTFTRLLSSLLLLFPQKNLLFETIITTTGKAF